VGGVGVVAGPASLAARGAAIVLALAILLPAAFAQAPAFPAAEARRADADELCRFVTDEYAYLDDKATDWRRACAALAYAAERAPDRDAFVAVLEDALRELYDPHAHLGVNTRRSPRLVPSGTDVAARWVEGRATVTAVRRGSRAEAAGVRDGDEVVAIDGVPVADAARARAPRFLVRDDPAAQDFALASALAGRHDVPRIRLQLRNDDGTREVAYDAGFPQPRGRLRAWRQGEVAHVTVHDALGEAALVGDFDRALACVDGARAIVIDLRDTPRGGTSSVARGIMGRLVATERPYQRHELVAEYRLSGVRRIWVEYVAPRGATFQGPVVVLVGPWTGSMGEGLAIGLDAARGAAVVGRPMARLRGALAERTLTHSGIVVRIPAEKLSHVDGRPREAFVPRPVAQRPGTGGDEELRAAHALAARLAQGATDPRDGPVPAADDGHDEDRVACPAGD